MMVKSNKSIIVANWKMNMKPSKFSEYFKSLINNLPEESDIIICPPNIYLKEIKDITKGSKIFLGSQNIWHENNGSFTGEISIEMVKDYASYCIVGHSERRENFKESDKTIAKKLTAITNAGLNGILCIGENYNLRSNNHYRKYLENQLRKALENIVDFSKVIIAYEPIWAIGTNNIATNNEILEITDIINTTINDICPGFNNKILYGGSVSETNISNLSELKSIDGLLIGKASLNINSFTKIIKSYEK